MDLHRLGVKVYAGDSGGISLEDLIPVFHRWIQQKALEGELLVDVADYSHVFAGPGTMLIAHEGNYGFDESDQRRGLVYYSKHELEGDLAGRLCLVARRALNACRLLEQETGLAAPLKFTPGEIQVFANDRMAAPNTDAGFGAMEPGLRAFLDRLYAGAGYRVERVVDDPRSRLTVNVSADGSPGVEELLARLS